MKLASKNVKYLECWSCGYTVLSAKCKCNKIFWFSTKFLISIFSKYVWVAPLNKEKAITMANALPKVLAESNREPNKIWVDKCRGLYNRLIRSVETKNLLRGCEFIGKCWPTFLAYLQDLLIKIV